MKYQELVKLDDVKLMEQLKEIQLELIKLNGQVATGTPPENPGQIRKLRRTVARIKTALNQK